MFYFTFIVLYLLFCNLLSLLNMLFGRSFPINTYRFIPFFLSIAWCSRVYLIDIQGIFGFVLPCFAITNNATMIILAAHAYLHVRVFFQGRYQERELLSHKLQVIKIFFSKIFKDFTQLHTSSVIITDILNFNRYCQIALQKLLYQFICPQSVYKNTSFPIHTSYQILSHKYFL